MVTTMHQALGSTATCWFSLEKIVLELYFQVKEQIALFLNLGGYLPDTTILGLNNWK